MNRDFFLAYDFEKEGEKQVLSLPFLKNETKRTGGWARRAVANAGGRA